MKEDWVECKLKDVGYIFSGGTPKTQNPEYWGDEVAWISPADLSNYAKKFISKGNKSITNLGLSKSSAKLIPKGSVLFSSRAPIGYVAIAKNDLATNQGFKSIYLFDGLYNEYVYYYLKASKHIAENNASGTTFREISKSAFAELPLPLPPLPIQRTIVSKIETLFSDLDKGIADLKKAQEQLKIYRQAVLKKAFEGELTKEWREQQTDLPTAGELLEQIKEERQKHYQQQLEEWKLAVKAWEENGKEGNRPSKPRKLTVFTVDFEENILKLPISWTEGLLEYIADAVDPQPSHRTPPIVENGIPYVSIADIDKATGEINFENSRKVGENVLREHINRYQIYKNDFVIGKIGTIGKPFFIPTKRFFTLSANVVLVQPFEGTCESKFLFYLNTSPIIEQQFKSGSKATTQAAFGIKKVRLLRVPLCSKQEQHQIVKEIESRLSVCDKVEQNIAEALDKSEALRQTILKKAFEGKLLSPAEVEACRQEADYEPASVLLERIKKERAG